MDRKLITRKDIELCDGSYLLSNLVETYGKNSLLSIESWYDNTTVSINHISPETDEEYNFRINQEKNKEEKKRDKLYQKYLDLKEIFEKE